MNVRSGASSVERFGGRAGLEAAVERHLPRREPEPLQLGGRVWAAACSRDGLPGAAGRRQDEPPGAPAGVLGHLADLGDVAELVRLAELALADRPRVGVGDRDEPVGDLLAARSAGRSARRPARQRPASCSSLASARSLACAPRPRAARRARRPAACASLTERAISSPGLLVELDHLRLALAGAARRASGRSPAPAAPPRASDRAPPAVARRSAPRACAPRAPAPLRPVSASIASVG